MIITRTPFRMSYVGGGTDIASFYRDGVARFYPLLLISICT